MKHRREVFRLLSGSGLEIGALHEPADLPEGCSVTYFDANDREAAARLYPELDRERLVPVDRVGDIDKRDLRSLGEGAYDFVIANHVIEHVANPVAMLEDIHFIVRSRGRAVIAAPDMRFTYDRERSLTPFDHLWREYLEGVESVSDDHYLDFLKHVGKHVFEEPGRRIEDDIAFSRRRREHAHVWSSDTFLAFVREATGRLGLDWRIIVSHPAAVDSHEVILVLERG